jgi:DNA-binding beta-propeller fold protein YncE
MKSLPTLFSRATVQLVLLGITVAALLLAAATVANSAAGQGHQQVVAGTPYYLPIIRKDPTPSPTPLPTPLPPAPQFVSYIPLPDVKCPNAVGFNPHSDYTYILNNYSANVTVFRGTEFVTHLPTGVWPTAFAAVPNSSHVYITNLHSYVSLIDGLDQIGQVPKFYEPYGVAYNPVNGYVYIADLDSTVQIAEGATLLKNLRLTDPDTGKDAGWLRSIVADPVTGLVYVASWEYGRMYVIDGLDVVASYRLGWGPLHMVLDPERGFIYVAHSDPNAAFPHNLSVFSLHDQSVTYLSTAVRSYQLDVDPFTGLVYATNPDDNTVSILQGTHFLGNLPAGKQPWGVAVHPNTAYAFVTNRSDYSVSIYKDGAPVTTINTLGLHPVAVGIDTNSNYVYVANRGEEFGLLDCRQGSVTILR